MTGLMQESQQILKYQNRSYDFYSDQMKAIVEEMMENSFMVQSKDLTLEQKEKHLSKLFLKWIV